MTKEKLLNSIKEIRKFGYCIENRTRIKDAVSVTVPVFHESGELVGVISSGFLLAKTPAEIENIKNYMLTQAANAADELGL